MHSIGFLLRTTELEWKSALKRPRYYVSLETQVSVCCKWAAIHCSMWSSSTLRSWGGIYEWRNEEIVMRIGKANAVLRELSVFKSVFVPILTYCHDSWVVTEIILSQVQATEIEFLRRVHGVTLRGKVRSSENSQSPECQTTSPPNRGSQLRWFGHVSRMPHERLARQVLLAKLTGTRPRGCPMTRWSDYIYLVWSRVVWTSKITWNSCWPWGT